MAVLPGSVNVETVEKDPEVSKKKQANRERRLAKRKRIQEEREELRSIKAGHSAKGGSKGKTKSKDQAGKPLCFSWASGSGVCGKVPPGGERLGAVKRIHMCRLMPQPITSRCIVPSGFSIATLERT